MNTQDTPTRRTARSGGRAARHALRAAKPADDMRSVRPGLSGGQLNILTPPQIEQIHQAALTALEDAASVAGLLITTEAMVADKPEPKGAGGAPGGMPDMGGMGGRM